MLVSEQALTFQRFAAALRVPLAKLDAMLLADKTTVDEIEDQFVVLAQTAAEAGAYAHRVINDRMVRR